MTSPSRRKDLLDRLRDNDLTEICCRCRYEIVDVADILQKQPSHSLKILRMDENIRIDVDCAALIANVINFNKSITELRFGWRNIMSDAIVTIFDALSNYNNTTLTKLALPMSFISNDAIVAMCRMLKTNYSLTELFIGCCGVNCYRAMEVGYALEQNTTLRSLDLRSNCFGDEGAIAIADGIKENDSSSLFSLNLSWNIFEEAGARSIATMLRTNQSLIELDLGGNKIGKEGAISIVESLKCNKTLSTLKLYDIPFGDEGASRIAELLTTNVSLKELDVNICGIGDDGAVAISFALNTNISLTRLYLQYNPFHRNVITNEFARMLEINTSLEELYLGGHVEPMDDVVAGVILNTLLDYNDTVNVDMFAEDALDGEILDKIKCIGADNSKGIRRATVKSERKRRSIFNSLKRMWMFKIA